MSGNRKKILFLSSWYPSEINPTNGNFVQKHAQSVQLNNDVVVLAIFSSSNDLSVRIEEHEINGVKEIIVYYPKKKNRFLFNFLTHFKSFKIGLSRAEDYLGKIQIVHLNVIYPLGLWALWLKMWRKIPYVVTEHSTYYNANSDHHRTTFKLWFAQKVLSRASYMLPVSEDLGNSLKKLYSKAPLKAISNVVDASVFQLKSHETDQKNTNFIHVSTAFDKQKNVTGLMHVFSKLNQIRTDFHLHVVSDGQVDSLKELVNKLHLNSLVTFYPTKSTGEIAAMMQQSDAFVLFSNYENFPCVIAESLMCGVPVISTDVNGIPEHVNSANGILIKRGDEAALLHVLIEFLDKRHSFNAVNIRDYAMHNFSYEAVSRQYNEIYEEVFQKQ